MLNYLSRKLLLILSLILSFTSQQVYAEKFSARIEPIILSVQNDYYELNADIKYTLSPTAKEALQKGIPLTWIVTIKIQQANLFWDTTIKELIFSYQIRNHALLNLYSVKLSGNESPNMFSSLTVALNFMSKIRNLKLIKKKLLTANIKHYIAIKTVFDREALPTPLRPMSYFNPQWALSSDWTLWQLQN